MADFYTWNKPNDSHRRVITMYLRLAQDYIELYPERLPFKNVETANAAINWMRALLDRKPSTLGEAAKRLIDRQADDGMEG